MKTTVTTLWSLGGLWLALLSGGLAAAEAKRPNVIFILADDLGIDGRTLVIFSSDNGQDNKMFLDRFQSNGPLRGNKRTTWPPAIGRLSRVLSPS